MADYETLSYDCKTIKEEILNNPERYQTSFVVNYGSGIRESRKEEAVQALLDFIGSDNVKNVQYLTGPYILLTMKSLDYMHDLLASVHQLEVRLSTNVNGVLCFFPVLPVPARVKLIISGIPRTLATLNYSNLQVQMEESLEKIGDIQLSVESRENVPAGHILAEVVTDDLKELHHKLQYIVDITCEEFCGRVKFFESMPLVLSHEAKFTSTARAKVYRWK